VSRTIWVPDYGASDSLYMPMEIPEPGEPGYISPADRIACVGPGDPLPPIIAREQAIGEALAEAAPGHCYRGPEPELEAEPEPEAEP